MIIGKFLLLDFFVKNVFSIKYSVISVNNKYYKNSILLNIIVLKNFLLFGINLFKLIFVKIYIVSNEVQHHLYYFLLFLNMAECL